MRVREATLEDLPAIDALQKAHSRQLGFMHRAALEGKIAAGNVIVAEGLRDLKEEGLRDIREEGLRDLGTEGLREEGGSAPLVPQSLSPSVPAFLGYLIGADRYKHRDELGVIFQLCVDPKYRRMLVAANLLKAQFERSAYGCRLYCCWCAQDLEANRFYESMGFVPIAYRAGGRGKGKAKGLRDLGTEGLREGGSAPLVPQSLSPSVPSSRIHIFWQKRIRAGDTTTPWWFPARTDAGTMREDRIVLPIPPGMHWSDELPAIQPPEPAEPAALIEPIKPRSKQTKTIDTPEPIRRNGLVFSIPKPGEAPATTAPPKAKKENAPRAKAKADPRLAAAARELRDRWMEQINAGRYLPESSAKYEIARLESPRHPQPHLLPAA
jgi:ribosomal protein S18 acetylase RimI-like enzyme